MGRDASVYEFLLKTKKMFSRVYHVSENHDIDNSEQKKLCNSDGSKIDINNNVVVLTPEFFMGRHKGIMSSKKKNNRFMEAEFRGNL